MPRTTRLTEVPQKQTPRGPPHLRTSSSASDPLHHRVRTERSPKIAEGRSPRGAQSDPVNKKKLGTRIADLESQLGQAQDELKSLKDQLVSAETAKKVAQEQLDKKPKKLQDVPESMQIQEKHSTSMKTEEMDIKSSSVTEFGSSDEVENETDVFEVPMETKTQVISRSGDLSSEMPVVTEPENITFDELGSKNDEINLLKTKLDEKDKEMDVFRQENQILKNELNEKSLKMSSDQSQIEELILKLNKVDQELENTKNSAFQINEKLIATEKAKEDLENEMKRLRVQTEQWRKAADAAASVLAGGEGYLRGVDPWIIIIEARMNRLVCIPVTLILLDQWMMKVMMLLKAEKERVRVLECLGSCGKRKARSRTLNFLLLVMCLCAIMLRIWLLAILFAISICILITPTLL